MTALKWARWLAWVATVLVVLLIGGAIFFSEFALGLVKAYEFTFRLIGLGIGPILAVLGFAWGLVDKAELKHLSHELGEARQRAEDAKKTADAARGEFDAKEARIQALQHDLTTIADAGRLWKLRKNAPFPEFRGWKFSPDGAKVVTFALFKGGVGKSHLAANFAAYVSEKHRKSVLLIDLDYQGSLSTFVLTAAGIEPAGSSVDALLGESAGLATLNAKRMHLATQGPQTILNGGHGLAHAWLVPADYTLAEVESKLLVSRVVHNSAALDERYRLAHVLLHPDVRREYAMIIIDTPPRMTLGTVNAFVASHSYVVPTILDRISSEAVRPFLEQVKLLKQDLQLDTQLAGIVGTMTRELLISDVEQRYFDEVAITVKEVLQTDRDYRIRQNVPRKKQVTDSDDLGYFLRDGEGPLRERFYDVAFDQLWTRIMSPGESA